MQASFDLFEDPPASTTPSLPACTSDALLRRHPHGMDRSRRAFREELGTSYVATVRFDVREGDVIRVSQFTPAGNQCIGLYPEPLKAIGRAMLVDVASSDGQTTEWTGMIEWDVSSDQATFAEAPGSDQVVESPCP
jgi:hypothetical protein